MKVSEVLDKANRGEGLTVEEIKIYNANVKEKKHVYGKYGTLAKRYIEEHNFGKLLSLAGHLPEYLHGVDKAAEALYDVLWDKLSKSEKYCCTGDYLEDVGGTYVINEEQAETVRIIYDLYLKGLGFNRIVNELIRLKRKDSSGQVRWEATKVCRILHNATYKGYQGYYKSYKNNHLEQKTVINRDEDTYLYVKGNFTPIIPEEVWDKCKEIRESKIKLRKTQEGKFEKSGLRTSEDIWAKRLRCRCGYHMRKDVWHPTKHGLTYGYKCYNVLNNGSKKVRIEVGLDAEKYCDMGAIADWKLDLMFQKILDELNLHNNDLVDKAYQKFEECYTRDAKDLRRLRDAEAKLRKIQMKIENLTEMRVSGEITKQEFSSMKNKINGEMLMAEKEVEEAKTLLLEEDKMAHPLIDKADFKDMVMEKLDFSTPIKQSNLVEAIVKKIVPNTTLDFTWYLNLFPRQEGNEDRDYREIKTFIIGYKTAKEFRKTRHTLLRENQWQDLMVRIMA